MPKCPSCNESIDYLVAKQTHTTGFAVQDGKPLYDDNLLDAFHYITADKEECWYCPLCGNNLFSVEQSAVEFFEKGGKHA